MSYSDINIKSPIEVKIEWKRPSSNPPLNLTISAFMLNGEGALKKMEDFVFYGSAKKGKHIVSSDNSIKGDSIDFFNGFGEKGTYKMSLDLKKNRSDIKSIMLVVSVNAKEILDNNVSFDNFDEAKLSMRDASGIISEIELLQDLSKDCRCVEVCSIYRYDKVWKFQEEMIQRLGGLEISYEIYGKQLKDYKPFSEIGDFSQIQWNYGDNKDGKTFGTIVKETLQKIFPSKPHEKEDFNDFDFFKDKEIKINQREEKIPPFFTEDSNKEDDGNKSNLDFFKNKETHIDLAPPKKKLTALSRNIKSLKDEKESGKMTVKEDFSFGNELNEEDFFNNNIV